MASDDSSCPRETFLLGKRGVPTPASFARTSSFAIAGVRLPGARRRVIGHQQFEQRLAGGENFIRIRLHLHVWLDRPDASGAEDARTGIHNAQPANTDGRLALQVAQGGDGDAVHARGIENGGA